MAPRFDKIDCCYIAKGYAPTGNQPKPVLDRNLITEAYQYRIAEQIMEPDDFYLNITVWRLEKKNGEVKYLKAVNDSEESQAQKVLDQRVEQEMGANPKASRRKVTAAVRKELKHFYVYSGVHSEIKVAEDVSRRDDVRQGLARITQVYTERAPCLSCREVMNNELKILKPVPFFFFLSGNKVIRRDSLKQYGWSYQLLLLNRYGGAQ
jgi:hypothetical protein